MYNECCVCKTLRKDASKLYRFPTSEKRLEKWLKYVNRQLTLLPEQTSKKFICDKHFEKKYISPTTGRLKVKAYPSLFTQGEISSGIPSHENAENIDPLTDHTYTHKDHEDHTYFKKDSQVIPVAIDGRQVEANQQINAEQAAPWKSFDGQLQDSVLVIPVATETIASTSAIGRYPLPETQLPKKPHELIASEEVTTCNSLEEQSQVQVIPVATETIASTSAIGRYPLPETQLPKKPHELIASEEVTTCNSLEEQSQVQVIPVATETIASTSAIGRYPLPETQLPKKPHELIASEEVTTCNSLEEQSQVQVIPVATETIASTSAIGRYPLPETQLPKKPHELIASEEVTTCNSLEEQSQVQGSLKDKVQSAKGTKAAKGTNAVKGTTAAEGQRRKRLIAKLSDLTPACRMIYNEFKKSKRQADFHRRAKRAQKFNKDKSFQKLTENMNPYAKRIMKMQINLCTKQKKGRRFSLDEKLVALAIMKQGPKCYRFLQKIFILPSRSTLNKMVSGLKIESGICPQIFELMRKETEEWDEKKKMCSVIFDEMSLETGLTYDKNKDNINGLVELDEKKNEFADHALVFMLRGAVHKWQQPVAFYFCQGATKGPELKKILAEVITAVAECGLKPISLICDQGSAFQSALNSLKEDTLRDRRLSNQAPDGTITINGINLMVIFDPPHLIKGLRNNFLNKNISINGKISRWSDIIDVYETDYNQAEVRLLHKLNDRDVIPEKIKKMKVKNCVKVFSKTVSAALLYTAKFSHYADGRPVSQTLKNTAETVLFFDELFDSVNGAAKYSKKSGKVLRTAVTETSPHHKFWPESVKKLENIKYVDARGCTKSVPSLKNFITTIKSFIMLWQFFKNQKLSIMRPRYFNSDPIENFFGQVRAYNYRSNDPNCYSFMCTYKSLLITRVISFHNNAFNCEDDPADQIINLKPLFENDNENVEPGHPGNSENILEQARRERLSIHSRAYTAGWVVTKTLKKFPEECDACKESLTTRKGFIHQWISQREYNDAADRLTYPSEGAVSAFGIITKETNKFLEQNAKEKNLSILIKEKIMSKNRFRFYKCDNHRSTTLSYFIYITIKFAITNWCNNITKILKGTDIARIENRTLSVMQQKAFGNIKRN